MVQQSSQPYIVTLVDKPTPQTTFADVLIGAFGITGVLVLVALVLGAVLALVLVKWNQRHRPEENHLPPITT
jgi:hypothetical protein